MSTLTTRTVGGPHGGEPLQTFGASLADATATVILLHGRGASAQSMQPLAEALGIHDVAYVAPQAAGHTWYPQSFLAPIEANQPWLDSALAVVHHLVEASQEEGVAPKQLVLLGFSQGACLATEAAARKPQRYGGVVGFSGGLIGTADKGEGAPPHDKAFAYEGSLDGTPVLLGCSDVDPHIPMARVQQTSKVLEALGAVVDERIYPGMAHTINNDELTAARHLLQGVIGRQG